VCFVKDCYQPMTNIIIHIILFLFYYMDLYISYHTTIYGMYPQLCTLQIWNELRLVISLIVNYTTCFSKKLNPRRWNKNIPMILNVQKWHLVLLVQYFLQILNLISFQLCWILDTCHVAHENNRFGVYIQVKLFHLYLGYAR
jgi:hypothetical protein